MMYIKSNPLGENIEKKSNNMLLLLGYRLSLVSLHRSTSTPEKSPKIGIYIISLSFPPNYWKSWEFQPLKIWKIPTLSRKTPRNSSRGWPWTRRSAPPLRPGSGPAGRPSAARWASSSSPPGRTPGKAGFFPGKIMGKISKSWKVWEDSGKYGKIHEHTMVFL